MIALLIDIIIICLVGGLAYWIVSLMPLPDPFKTVMVVCVLVIFLLVLLARLTGYGGVHLVGLG